MAIDAIISNADVLTYLNIESATAADTALLNQLVPKAEIIVKQYLRSPILQGTFTDYLPLNNPLDNRDGAAMFQDQHIGSIYGIASGWRSLSYHGKSIQLSQTPVRSVTTVHEQRGAYAGTADSAWGSSALLVAGDDFYLDTQFSGFSATGLLNRIGTGWPSTPQSVKVVYVAGYTAAELAGNVTDYRLSANGIVLGLLMTAAELFTQSRRQSASSGGGGPVKSERLGEYSVTYDVDSSGSSVLIPQDALEILEPFVNKSSMVM